MLAGLSQPSQPGGLDLQRASENRFLVWAWVPGQSMECERSRASLEMPLLGLSSHFRYGRPAREGQEYEVKGTGPLISVLPEAMGGVG